MACKTYGRKAPDSTWYAVTVCGPRARARKCAACGRPSSKLCDWPLEQFGDQPEKTCDKPLCTACARHTPPDTDVCKTHPEIRTK